MNFCAVTADLNRYQRQIDAEAAEEAAREDWESDHSFRELIGDEEVDEILSYLLSNPEGARKSLQITLDNAWREHVAYSIRQAEEDRAELEAA